VKGSITRNKKIKERIYITKDELESIESGLSLDAHIQRYGFVRQYAHGNVLDCACGCGYGTYMLSKNPDVESIVGVDVLKGAIEYANLHFTNDKVSFRCGDIGKMVLLKQVDQLISIETIEHLQYPLDLINMVVKNNINELIISFPTKKSTHYNKYHYHDFTFNDIKMLLSDQYRIRDSFEYKREVGFVFCVRSKLQERNKK